MNDDDKVTIGEVGNDNGERERKRERRGEERRWEEWRDDCGS